MHEQVPQLQRHGPALMPVRVPEDWFMHEPYAKMSRIRGRVGQVGH